MRVALIVAGGEGDRLGRGGGKQLATVAGRPVLTHTLRAFDAASSVDAIVVVTHPDRLEEYRSCAIEPVHSAKVVAVVGGGETRQASVSRGLEAVPAEAEVVLVHDGARPIVTPDLIDRAVAELEANDSLDGVVVGHPSYDTLKIVDVSGLVVETVDRSIYWAAQTPQVFRAAALRSAYETANAAGALGTDDASLVERNGGRVGMLSGPRDNLKITVAEDLAIAEVLLGAGQEGEFGG